MSFAPFFGNPLARACPVSARIRAETSLSNRNYSFLMFQKLNKNHGGFTLVEIMIVVAIIAMLAAIAVPNFLRARKRSQATRILQDLRVIDAAIDQYAIENNKSGGQPVNWTDIQAYLKKNSVIYNSNGTDLLSNKFNDGSAYSVDYLPKLSTTSYKALSDVAPNNFWSPFY